MELENRYLFQNSALKRVSSLVVVPSNIKGSLHSVFKLFTNSGKKRLRDLPIGTIVEHKTRGAYYMSTAT